MIKHHSIVSSKKCHIIVYNEKSVIVYYVMEEPSYCSRDDVTFYYVVRKVFRTVYEEHTFLLWGTSAVHCNTVLHDKKNFIVYMWSL